MGVARSYVNNFPVDLEKLDSCTRVQTLVLRENCLAVVRDIECCHELWNIDLTGNKVRQL